MENSLTTVCPAIRTTMVDGSWIELKLPEEFDKLFVDGVLIDPRNGTPFEMDGYSAYLALTAIEIRTGHNFRKEKLRLLKAVLHRLDKIKPPFSHGSFTGSNREIHLRMTATAVRLLGEAFTDGLLPDIDALVRALRYHFSFSEDLNKGVWFLHDSLEVAATGVAYPDRRNPLYRRCKNHAWGSSLENNLVLNTHLDTLTTGIHILPLLPQADAVWLKKEIEAGIAALSYVLDIPSRIWNLLSKFDGMARNVLFNTYRDNFPAAKYFRKSITSIYFPIRVRFRSRWPNYVMGDGYLERDICLPGHSFEYHLVNVWDLARFAHQMRNSVFASHTDVIRKCEIIAERGIDYAIDSSYWNYVIWSTRVDGRAIMLCEALLLRLSCLESEEVPEKWLRAYCDVRRRVAPSPAVLGYDPLIGAGGRKISSRCGGGDYVDLLDGRRLKIDIPEMSCEWC
jgi:hypothetical protein